jgi:hypothetical protein
MGTLVAGRRYVGVDPSVKTATALYHLGSRICEHLDISRDSFKILESPIQAVPNGIFEADFALTSPPYWTREIYEGVDATTSVDEWVQDFLEPLFQKTRSNLRAGSVFAVNVTDVKDGRRVVPLEKLTVESAQKAGFSYEGSWRMLRTSGDFETIFCFMV